MSYPIADNSNKANAAKEHLDTLVNLNATSQVAIIDRINEMVIKDALIDLSSVNYQYTDKLRIWAGSGEWTVHPHAVTQLASILEYPKLYLNKLQEGLTGCDVRSSRDKIATDLRWHSKNLELFDRKKQPAKFLVRYVDNHVRGILSRSFKRHLASKPLLSAFLDACNLMGLVPMGGTYSDVLVTLNCVLPYVFEPVSGEFVAFGVTWQNSDFGAGKMKVSVFMKHISARSAIVMTEAISKVHIGAIIEEEDIELSEDTIEKELVAQRSAINDVVHHQLSVENVEKLIKVIQAADAEQMPWTQLKTQLGRLLQKTELAQLQSMLNEPIQELPALKMDKFNDPVPSRWWASAAVGRLAILQSSEDRKKELQEVAGSLLGNVK